MACWFKTVPLPALSVPIRLFLFRHGQSEANLSPHIISGRSNSVALTSLGELQAKKLGNFLKGKEEFSFDLCFASSAVRARDTARFALGGAPMTEHDELQEIEMGDWVGKERSEVITPEVQEERKKNNWEWKCPNGESQKDVEERMTSFLENVVFPRIEKIENPSRREIKVALFGHFVSTACLVRKVLCSTPDMTWKLRMSNTAYSELSFSPDNGWFVQKLNATPHLI